MAFIPEDGSGVADANSLASVEFADAYHAERGNGAWADLEAEAKKQNLVKATDYVVAVFGGVWNGELVAVNQSLPFPRIVDYASIGNPIGIRQAVVELALIAATTPLMPTMSRGKKRIKIGPLEVEYDGNSATQKQFIAATYRIAPYLRSVSNAMVKLTRC